MSWCPQLNAVWTTDATREAATHHDATVPSGDAGHRRAPAYAEMMARYLGPVIVGALAEDDITEIYVNPSDGRIRLDSRSRGPIDTRAELDAARIELFLNAVAARRGYVLGPDTPLL